jgi:hypothetical protein
MSDVASEHGEYANAAPLWKKCRDASAGQEAVHAAGPAYLPKLSAQTDTEYDAYKGRSLYYNATGRTVDGLTGLIFRRPPTTEVPAAVDFLMEDVDTSGTPLLAFCEKVADELTTVGRFGLLADYPPMEQARTLADERAAGARPYATLYRAEAVINWRSARIGNRTQLTLAVLRETHDVEDGYGVKSVPQLRVLQLKAGTYQVELWRKADAGPDKDKWILAQAFTPLMRGTPMNFIPFVLCGPMGVDWCVAKPPILDLVNVNLSHYRSTADYEHGLHFTGLPTPVVYGHTFDTGETFALGSTVVKGFPDPNAKAEFMEFQGDGLKQLSKRLEEKEQMMAALGARMLASEKRAVEAAETAAIHRSGENSVLASLANAAGAAISKALTWCAQWAGVAEPVRVELNTDYLPAGMTAQELTALVSAWQAGAVSHETLYDNLQRGEIAQQGVDFDDEKGKIEAEGPKLGAMGAAGAA